jgi:hypothetical protein
MARRTNSSGEIFLLILPPSREQVFKGLDEAEGGRISGKKPFTFRPLFSRIGENSGEKDGQLLQLRFFTEEGQNEGQVLY